MPLSRHRETPPPVPLASEPFGFDLFAICHALTELSAMAAAQVCRDGELDDAVRTELAAFLERLAHNHLQLARAVATGDHARTH